MKIFDDFAKKIITKKDLIFCLKEINLVKKLIFKNINIPLSKKTKEKISENFRKEIERLENKKIISKDPEKNLILFENFEKYLQNLPQIKIKIAFHAKKKFVNKISFWLKKEIKQKVILDLIFNPKIVGGAIIEYKGRQINLSLDKKIDTLVSQKKL